MPAEKRPLRIIRTTTPRSAGTANVWGLTLDCGHYVERADVACSDTHPRARCDDCLLEAKPVAPLIVPCTMCNLTSDGYGAPGCGACYGFGRVEKVIHLRDLIEGPKPGGAPGDHILGFWIANLNGDLLTTTIAKRGRHYIGEHRRCSIGDPEGVDMEMLKKADATKIENVGNGITVIRDRFFPTGSISQDFLLQDAERKFTESFDAQLVAAEEGTAGLAGSVFKRVFCEVRTTNIRRVLDLEEAMMNQLMAAE